MTQSVKAVTTMKTALLVIDVQHALCSGEEEAFDSRGVIGRINHLVRLAREAKAPVFFIQHEEEGGALAYRSEGWVLDAALEARDADPRIRKQKPDSFEGTGLRAALQPLGIDHLVVCGLQSDCCIDATTRGALVLGYAVTLVADAHSTVDSGGSKAAEISARHNAALAALDGDAAKVSLIRAADVRIGVT
jgi:nicotinamidase-related amidase